MRNVILGAMATWLCGAPAAGSATLSAQDSAPLASWSAPCFPAGSCGDGPARLLQSSPVVSAVADGRPAGTRISLWPHAVTTVAALALGSTLDGAVRREVQSHRSVSGDDLARLARRVGQPEVYAPAALGTVAVGLLAGDARVLRAGGRITGSLLLAGATVNLLKPLVGRARPRFGAEPSHFRPLSNQDSWPSGHTAVAFALATSVSDELRFTPASVALYGAATLTAWSRVNDDRHWATDVAAGALVGMASAKVMNGRWRVFGVGGPEFLLDGDRAGLRLAF
jgi:membrane-associated phospholipid phosphatase